MGVVLNKKPFVIDPKEEITCLEGSVFILSRPSVLSSLDGRLRIILGEWKIHQIFVISTFLPFRNSAVMLSCVSKQLVCGKNILRIGSSLAGRRFFSATSDVEYEIVENMKTYPLFTEKLNVCILFIDNQVACW